jgi:hypothetical protein
MTVASPTRYDRCWRDEGKRWGLNGGWEEGKQKERKLVIRFWPQKASNELTTGAREKVAHLPSDRTVTTDMGTRIKRGVKVTLELHPEFVKGRIGQNLCDGGRREVRNEGVVETSG